MECFLLALVQQLQFAPGRKYARGFAHLLSNAYNTCAEYQYLISSGEEIRVQEGARSTQT